MKNTRFLLLGLIVLSSPWSGSRQALADVDTRAYCRLAVHEEQVQLDERELSVELAESTLKAAEEIFVLADGLWQNQAIQRMAFLRYKHDRDVAKLGLQRNKRLLERQSSVVEQFTLLCAGAAGGESSADARRAIDRAYRRYREADCTSRELDVKIGQVDTTFYIEMLESVRDLRAGDVATRQDVIIAERDLEMARKRMQRATERTQACRREIPPAPH